MILAYGHDVRVNYGPRDHNLHGRPAAGPPAQSSAQVARNRAEAARLGDLLTPPLYPIDGGYIVSLAIDGQPSAIIELM